MKILFSTGHFGFLRNFESTLRLLAERGHTVHLVADRRDRTDGARMVEALTCAYPHQFSAEVLPPSKQERWYPLGTACRSSLDYWRYLRPGLEGATALRSRARRQAHPLAARLAEWPGGRARAGLAALSAAARACDRAIPPRPEVGALLDRLAPDVVMLTPLLYFGSQQPDYVRAARARGIPSVLCVGSWDHLTTKGLIHEVPDRVVVWNEAQRAEAARFHGVPPSRVVVTGAQPYDHWFTTRPSTTREAFCARVGLPPERPILLYLCSSPFIAPEEVPFVRRWMAAVRASADPVLRGASLLVRPHPQNSRQWQGVRLQDADAGAVVWPETGANPVDAEARAQYYDSMFHSLAVVGVNTSALIESGIVGRVVYSVATDDFAGTQEATLHFQHLKSVNGGLLHLATSLDEHVAQLERLVSGRDAAVPPREFVEGFVRPHGLDVPATPRVVDAIEATARLRPAREPDPLGRRVLRGLLSPVAALAQATASRRSTHQP